jgi:hypothetical protein
MARNGTHSDRSIERKGERKQYPRDIANLCHHPENVEYLHSRMAKCLKNCFFAFLPNVYYFSTMEMRHPILCLLVPNIGQPGIQCLDGTFNIITLGISLEGISQ